MAQTKLYVGNLPYRLRKDQLIDFFSGCGDITDARIIKDKNTGRSKGFAFVTFADEAHTQSALAMDGLELEGRPLKINFANDKDSEAAGASNTAAPRANVNANSNAVSNGKQAQRQTSTQSSNDTSSAQKASGVESRNRGVDIVVGIAIGLVAGLLICQFL